MRFLGGIKACVFFLMPVALVAQDNRVVPKVFSNIEIDENGQLFVLLNGQRFEEFNEDNPFTLEQLKGNLSGTETGIDFDFGREDFEGTLFYGFIPYGDSKHPMPVYRKSVDISNGKARIDIANKMGGIYDMIDWQETGTGTIGYRVVHSGGTILYDGKVTFEGIGPFDIGTTITEGPFVNLLTPDGATISFETNDVVVGKIIVNDKIFQSEATRHHEITLTGVTADTEYQYTVQAGAVKQSFSFRTAPEPGARTPFIFSYCSDSRSGHGGGERDVYGANFYIMKKIMALNLAKKARFCQFTGDLVDGYLSNFGEMELQYANWKRAVEPFAHYIPIVAGIGNHEALNLVFRHAETRQSFSVDRFPFATESMEALFAKNFVNPLNGPVSEDGAVYDPNPNQQDFPGYKENVFYYTYDNVAIVSLNSDYWYTPNKTVVRLTGGCIHGYVMDMQLQWFAKALEKFENDATIDHIFVTIHTPFFPNGGHVKDDMWYDGENKWRPFVAGKPLAKGIIERRDELLDLLINRSEKVVALLTGDEHNYNKLELGPDTPIYPEDYPAKKIKLKRTVYQINNGAAGAPYYAQEATPWSDFVSGFTTQHALVFFSVNGKKIEVEVLNPDTLEEVDRFTLR